MSHRAVGLLRRFPLTLLAVLCMLSACGKYGDHALNWDEDVLLDDGMQVRIKRHAAFTDWNSLAQDSYYGDYRAYGLRSASHTEAAHA